MPLEYDITLRDGEAGAITLEGRPSSPEAGCFVLHRVAGLLDGAELRDTVEDLAGADGQFLGPQFLAGLTPSLSGVIVGLNRVDLRQRQRALKAAVRGGAGGPVWQLRISGHAGFGDDLILPVRVAQPLVSPDQGDDNAPRTWAPFALGLRSPSSALWGATERTAVIAPADSSGGRSYDPPQVYPWDYGGEGAPPTPVTNAGDARYWPALDLFGPLEDPVVENLTTGLGIELPGLELAAGEHLRIVTAPGVRTITMVDGPAPANRYAALDRVASRWWALEPGENLVRLRVTEWEPPGRVVVTWRHAY